MEKFKIFISKLKDNLYFLLIDIRVYKRSFFNDSEGNPMPPYFWITIIMTAVCFDLWRKVFEDKLTLPFLGTVLGFVTAWMAIYNWQKIKKQN